jgi:hypothetical protein
MDWNERQIKEKENIKRWKNTKMKGKQITITNKRRKITNTKKKSWNGM